MAKTGKPKPRGRAGAARLRATIADVTKRSQDSAPAPDAGGESKPLSPRELIHKRMAELDKKNRG